MTDTHLNMQKPIAIVGIGCRMPGGVSSPDDFWRVIRDGEDVITDVPPGRWSNGNFYNPDKSKRGKIVSKKGGFIDDIDKFDNTFFKISPKEAASMDPQQRHLLEVVHEAFEDAGIISDDVGGNTGVYVGIGMPDYRIQTAEIPLIDAYTLTGSSHSLAANRISYAFNLKGPSCSVDTACASSITAMHLACAGLTQDECEVAVVAGCNALLIPEISIGFSALGVLSPDGKCCPFSSSAKGYVRSEGCGVLILKPLSSALKDCDHVYAVIRGTAIAANGSSQSLTMPSGSAQENVMKKAYARCGVSMTDVQYLEAHGTGTHVGDTIEAEAIGKAFAPYRQTPLRIGSVKSNFGHSEYAAGITASIKVALMLHRRELCASINFTNLHPAIDGQKWKIKVQTEPEPLQANKRAIFGLNSFGFGGAVAHAIFEESPRTGPCISMDNHNADWKFGTDDQGENIIIPLSAKTQEALTSVAECWKKFKCEKDAQSVVSWLATRRMHHECRLTIISSSGKEFKEKLSQYVEEGCLDDGLKTGSVCSNQPIKVCMVFPGQGQQWQDMGRKLYATEDAFKSVVNSCDVIFQELAGWSLLRRTWLFVESGRYADDEAPDVDINDTVISQPAIMFFQIGLFHLWRHWGVTPAVVVGHSLGEVAAAYACGGITLSDAVKIIYHRSNEQAKLKGVGSMVAVRLSLLAALELCSSKENLHVAAVNSPTSITIAGSCGSIADISTSPTGGTPTMIKKLRVESAYHTPNMDTIKGSFMTAMNGTIKTEPRDRSIKLYSTVTGQLYTGDFDTNYWWDNIRNPVDFQAAIEAILEDESPDVFLECAASVTLISPIKQILRTSGKEAVVTSIPSGVRKQDDRVTALRALGCLYTVGVDVNWRNITKDCAEWVSFPTYRWQHQSFWVESNTRRNQRLGQDDRTFHGQGGQISLDVFPSLSDHVIEGDIVFPGAGYVEYAIEAYVPLTKNPNLKFISFQKMLLWSMNSTGKASTRSQLHLACTKEGSTISIAAEQMVHSSAVLDMKDTEFRCQSVQIDTVLSRCRNKVSSQTFYEDLSAVGLQYGPAFQVVEEASLGDGEILGFLCPAPSNKQRVQVTHLDGCFQLLVTASRSRLSLYVPVAIECIRMHVASLPTGENLVAHATITDYDAHTLKGDILLAAGDGTVLVEIKGCQCSNMSRKVTKGHPEQWMYTTQYQDIISGLPSTEVVADIFNEENLLKSNHNGVNVVRNAGDALPDLKSIVASYIIKALTVVPQYELDPKRQLYMKRLEEIAHDVSTPVIPPADISVKISSLMADIPDLRAELKLVQGFGTILPEALGVPSSAISEPEGLPNYLSESRIVQFFYKAGSEAIVKAIKEASKSQHVVRVLEIGSTNGAFTNEVAGQLQDLGHRGLVEYTCSYGDLSECLHPSLKLDTFPFVKYKQLDIDQDPERAGLVHDSTDMIICLDVLRTTADLKTKICQLRNLLCHNGWLFVLDITNMHHVAELMHGSLDRCWTYDVTRQDTCWLSQSDWVRIIKNQGFYDVRAVSTPKEFWQSIIVGRKASSVERTHITSNPKWFQVSKGGSIGLKDKLVNNLDEEDFILITSTSHEETLRKNEPKTSGIRLVYMWDKSDVNANALTRFLQHLDSKKSGMFTKVFVILSGDGVDVAAARGLIRAVTNQSMVPIISIHLEDTAQESTDALLGLLTGTSEPPDRELLITSGRVRVPRVMRLNVQDIRTDPSDIWQLVQNREQKQQPSLHNLGFISRPDIEPLDDDGVVVKIRAASLNFKDVMNVLGMLDGLEDEHESVHLGIECSGVVVKTGAQVSDLQVGDEVVGFGRHCFASHTTTVAELLAPKPKGLSWTECAGLSVIFSTAYYSLLVRANLQRNETVLIHSACGGVGLAAIQVARMIGSKIICSAGTDEKRRFLEQELGVEMVTDSRSQKFYDDVMAWTENRGVDVVLNSLNGDLMIKGIELLAPGGRFCEIGKRDILQNSNLQMNLWLENKSLLSCQIDRLIKLQRTKAGDVLLKVVSLFEKGTFTPVTNTVMSIGNHLPAFSTLAKGSHIGKIVFEVPIDFRPSKFLPSPILFKSSATYIITGGHGGLGLELARWLCDKGARYIVLVSHHGCQSASARRTVSLLRRRNAKVYNFAVDISDRDNVKAMFADLKNEFQAPPCGGVFHLAGVITEESLHSLNPDLMSRIMGAKATGARHLHLESLNEPLHVFFTMSSSVALWGNSSQPGYVAANSYLDALAEDRRANGLPALSLQLGSVTGAGYLETNSAPLRALEKKGQLSLEVNEMLHCLTHLFQRKWLPPVVCLTNQDWDLNLKFCHTDTMKFRHLTVGERASQPTPAATSSVENENQMRKKMGELLNMDPQEINLKKPMVNYGVDSLMAIEMVSWVSNELGVALTQMEVLSGISAEGVIERVPGRQCLPR